jgi:hypothetical protein
MITWSSITRSVLRIIVGSLGSRQGSQQRPPSSSSSSVLRSSQPSSTRSSVSLPLSADDSRWPDWATRPADAGVVYQCHFCGPAWQVKWSPVDRHGDTILAYYRHLARHGAAATVEALERSIFDNMIRRNGL